MYDRDLEIVAYKVFMLLILLLIDNFNDSVDCIIYVWYSALILKSDLLILQPKPVLLSEGLVETLKPNYSIATWEKTWTCGNRRTKLALEKLS